MIYRRPAWPIGALILLTLAVHSPSLQNGFIWDDDDHLTQNRVVAAPDGLRLIWSRIEASRYYPLTLTTFWMERRLWNLEPLPYHAVNLALHAATAVLWFLLLRRLGLTGAWFAAAIWAIHPVNVESVAWVTELKNTQSGLFFILALLSYHQFDERRRPGWYALALALFAAALLSKPSTIFLPAVLLLYAWWRREQVSRQDLLRSLPFFVLALAMSWLTVAEQQFNVRHESTAEWSLPLADRFIVAGKAFWFYLGKLVWPVPVTFVYPRWAIRADSIAAWLPLVLAIGTVVALGSLRRHSGARTALFGLGYIAGALFPVLGFFNIYYFRYSFVADHFNYLASIGGIALAVAAISTLIRSWPGRAAAGVAALAALAPLSWTHGQVFRTDETLWSDTLEKSPDAAIAHNNLGNIRRQQGRLAEAEEHFRKALALSPAYPQVHNNFGVALAELGRLEDATHHFAEAVRLQPKFTDAWENLAQALVTQGDLEKALPALRHVAELRPLAAQSYLQLGEVLTRCGRYAEALEAYSDGVAALPDHLHLANELAWLLATCPEAELRRPAAAVEIAKRLCERTGRRVPELLRTEAAAYGAAGRRTEAAATARTALALAENQGQTNLVKDLRERLRQYENAEPARWSPTDLESD